MGSILVDHHYMINRRWDKAKTMEIFIIKLIVHRLVDPSCEIGTTWLQKTMRSGVIILRK